MNKKDKKQVEIAIDHLIDGESGNFDLAIKILCNLIGRNIVNDEPTHIEYLCVSEIIKMAKIEAGNS